jgi:hypothetical protein
MAYTSDSPTERLAAVRAAMARALDSQEYSLRGRRQRSAELRDLRALEKELMQEVAQQSGGSVALGMQVRPS